MGERDAAAEERTNVGWAPISRGDGDDFIAGYAGTNIFYGAFGDDTLIGNEDSDELFGGDGNDVLEASTGADFVAGGAGNDRLSANSEGSGAGHKAVDMFSSRARSDATW